MVKERIVTNISISDIEKTLDVITKGIVSVLPVEVIYLFGSFATGDAQEGSDLDIYVVISDEFTGRVHDAIDTARLSYQMDVNIPTDVIVRRHSEFDLRCREYRLEKDICNKGKVLYERKRDQRAA
jgi:predicted nucleotidyltransferase